MSQCAICDTSMLCIRRNKTWHYIYIYIHNTIWYVGAGSEWSLRNFRKLGPQRHSVALCELNFWSSTFSCHCRLLESHSLHLQVGVQGWQWWSKHSFFVCRVANPGSVFAALPWKESFLTKLWLEAWSANALLWQRVCFLENRGALRRVWRLITGWKLGRAVGMILCQVLHLHTALVLTHGRPAHLSVVCFCVHGDHFWPRMHVEFATFFFGLPWQVLNRQRAVSQ